jgi:hypothetical protein
MMLLEDREQVGVKVEVNWAGKFILIVAVADSGLVRVMEKVREVVWRTSLLVDERLEEERVLGEVVIARLPDEISEEDLLMVTVMDLRAELIRVLTVEILKIKVVPLAIKVEIEPMVYTLSRDVLPVALVMVVMLPP